MESIKCYLYILESELNNSLYIGQSNNVLKRLDEHNNGYNKSTKSKNTLETNIQYSIGRQITSNKIRKEIKELEKKEIIFFLDR